LNYAVVLSQDAQDFLARLDRQLSERIEKRLQRLEYNPFPSDSKFITRKQGEKMFRYRIGDYRALYKVKEQERLVLVTRIDKRPRVYD
jgi:mRNA interferase RelE/StbE